RGRDNKAQRADLEVGIVREEVQSSGVGRPPAMLAKDEFAAVNEVVPVLAGAAKVLEAGAKCGNRQNHVAPPDDSAEHGHEVRQAALVDQGHEARYRSAIVRIRRRRTDHPTPGQALGRTLRETHCGRAARPPWGRQKMSNRTIQWGGVAGMTFVVLILITVF